MAQAKSTTILSRDLSGQSPNIFIIGRMGKRGFIAPAPGFVSPQADCHFHILKQVSQYSNSAHTCARVQGWAYRGLQIMERQSDLAQVLPAPHFGMEDSVAGRAASR